MSAGNYGCMCEVLLVNVSEPLCVRNHKQNNGVARTLKKLRTSKGDYSIAFLLKMGTSLKGKNLLQEGANSFL